MKAVKETIRKYYKYNDIDWKQPVLTSNTSFSLMTVSATTEYDSNYASWKAFDNSDSTAWITNIVTNTGSLRVQFDKILRINSITVTGFRNASSYCKTVEIYKDINNTKLIGEQKQFYTSTGNTLNGIQTWTFDTPVETDFLSFYSTSPVINGWTGISNIVINAVELNIIESTESDYDFYKDINTYKLPKEVVRKYYKYITTEYNRPNLTEDGQLGGDSPACLASGIQSGYPAFQAFDGVDTTSWVSYNGYSTPYIIFYDPNGVEVKSIDIYVQMDANRIATCDILGSNDNETYYLLGSAENSSQVPFTLHIDTSDNTTFYKYIKLQVNSIIASPYAYCSVAELRINGNCITSVETTKDDYDFYEDKEVYYGIGD